MPPGISGRRAPATIDLSRPRHLSAAKSTKENSLRFGFPIVVSRPIWSKIELMETVSFCAIGRALVCYPVQGDAALKQRDKPSAVIGAKIGLFQQSLLTL